MRVYALRGHKLASFNDQLKQAVELLPSADKPMIFDDYKAQLYSVNPDGGKAVFTHMIKNDLLRKELARDSSGNVILVVSKLAVK
jgi:hypothetical protein